MFLATAAGLFIGSVLGLVGAGGAMVSVPILLYLFHFTPIAATTAALAIVFAAALTALIPKLMKREVLIREALAIWAFGLITNIGGALIAKHLPDAFITIGFAGILILAGTTMLRPPVHGEEEKRISFLTLIILSLVIGSMTGIFGVGGGFLAIPVLVLYFHTPHAKAAGTSLLIIAANCLTSFIAHRSSWSQVDWAIPIEIAMVAALTSTYASHHSSKVRAAILRKAFAYLLYAIALFTVIHTWVYTK